MTALIAKKKIIKRFIDQPCKGHFSESDAFYVNFKINLNTGIYSAAFL